MDLEGAETELYGLRPDDFIAARTALAKAAKAEGERELSKQIQAMRKPTLTAWLANQLSRQRPAQLESLLVLGDGLREATAALDGERLGELSPRRRQVVEELVGHSGEIATEAGLKVSDDTATRLYETLDAAVVDAAAGAAVRAGRLTHALRHLGFGIVDETGEPADVISLSEVRAARARRTKATARSRPADEDSGAATAERRRVAEKRLADAEADLDAANARSDQLTAQVADITARIEQAEGQIQRLTADLRTAQDELREAKPGLRKAKGELERAERTARAARRRRDEARDAVPDG